MTDDEAQKLVDLAVGLVAPAGVREPARDRAARLAARYGPALAVVAWFAVSLGLAWYSQAVESDLALGIALLVTISPIILMVLLGGQGFDGLDEGP